MEMSLPGSVVWPQVYMTMLLAVSGNPAQRLPEFSGEVCVCV